MKSAKDNWELLVFKVDELIQGQKLLHEDIKEINENLASHDKAVDLLSQRLATVEKELDEYKLDLLNVKNEVKENSGYRFRNSGTARVAGGVGGVSLAGLLYYILTHLL